jgi:hypothetical protein
MTDPSKEEERALTRDELELVSAARHPGLREMGDRELGDLVRRLRDRRDRARDEADRQRREMRGKAEPAGATPASDNAGTRSKEHFLGAALARAMEERERREGEEHAMQDKGKRQEQPGQGQSQSQHDIAEKAMEMRKEADKHKPEHPENTPEPAQGIQPIPNAEAEPPIQQEGRRVVVDRTQRPR